jgi:hypothetical protein
MLKPEVRIIKNSEDLEREITIYPEQIADLFDVLIFDKENTKILKQNKNGKIEEVQLELTTNSDEIEEENKKIVFEALLKSLKEYAQENNMKILVGENQIYIIDKNYLNNIITINENENGETTIGTEQEVYITYPLNENEYKELIKYLKEYQENKEIDRKERFENFTSKEISVLKRDISLLNAEKERDKLTYNLQKLEFEKKIREEFEQKEEEITEKMAEEGKKLLEKLEKCKNIREKKEIQIVGLTDELYEKERNIQDNQKVIEEQIEIIGDIREEISKMKNKSIIPTILIITIISILIGFGTGISIDKEKIIKKVPQLEKVLKQEAKILTSEEITDSNTTKETIEAQ